MGEGTCPYQPSTGWGREKSEPRLPLLGPRRPGVILYGGRGQVWKNPGPLTLGPPVPSLGPTSGPSPVPAQFTPALGTPLPTCTPSHMWGAKGWPLQDVLILMPRTCDPASLQGFADVLLVTRREVTLGYPMGPMSSCESLKITDSSPAVVRGAGKKAAGSESCTTWL